LNSTVSQINSAIGLKAPMSSTSSHDDDVLSITPSETSVKDEVVSVGKVVRAERSKDAVTIAVASVYSLSRLKKACKYRKGFFESGEGLCLI
jgi:hypothetical protein